MLSFLLRFAISTVAVTFGYWRSRKFVSERLRYVEVINSPVTPVVAALGAGALAMPIVAFLPLVGAGTAVAFGISVGLGVAAGRSDIHRSLPPAS